MDVKKYMKIVRLGHKSTADVLKKGDRITITEKIDGANASFAVSDDVVHGFSRNNPVTKDNRLRGFYDFIQTLDPDKLLPNKRYYGEWCVKHKVNYGDNFNKFFLFDIYDEYSGEYLPLEFVRSEAERLELNLVPVFYEGEYKDYDHLMSYVGKSELTKDGDGEGVVVKNLEYRDEFGNQVFVKLVSDAFREKKKQKSPKDPSKQPQEFEFVNTFLTRARVEKFLYKLVDEGILSEDFGIEDMGVILKNLGNRLYDDLINEEGVSLPEDHEEKVLRKGIGKSLPKIVKEILK